MTRTKDQLFKSRERINAAIEALRVELQEIENELRGQDRGVPLNDVFFWEKVVPLLAKFSGGLSSADISRRLEVAGHDVNTVSLRTFLSRNKSRGRLVNVGNSNPAKWQISSATAELAGRLGVRIAKQPENKNNENKLN